MDDWNLMMMVVIGMGLCFEIFVHFDFDGGWNKMIPPQRKELEGGMREKDKMA